MMKAAIFFAVAMSMVFTAPAYAGSKNKSSSTATAISQNYNGNSNSVSNSIKQRVQPGNVSGFGGGACPEGFSASFPGGGLSFQAQCPQYKQSMKAATVGTYFDGASVRQWMCETDRQLYSLPACRSLRIQKSGVVQRRDRRR
jgi:hypothetical protein